MARTSVLVTGIGLVSPHGHDHAKVFEALMRGQSAIGVTRSPLQIVSPSTIRPHAAEPPLATVDFDPSPWMTKLERVGADRVSQMAVAAARLATQDAQLGGWADAERVGVYCGTGMGGVGSVEAG
ncbi:MAG: beta-ketoacyl synthase, partial [Rhizobacter sp.]|nr:beta-ketoacyl synthase [Rhizobacter sp.]